MSLLDWLLGRKPTEKAPQPEIQTRHEPLVQDPYHANAKRPFETIAEAEEAWRARDLARAEGLFNEGVKAYELHDSSAVAFALGRYGAFLLDLDRRSDALCVLEEAIRRNTDIPAIWSDYLRIQADLRDIEAFTRGVELMRQAVKHQIEPESVLMYARRADREGASGFAEAIARWEIARATAGGDKEGRWAAIGDLGHILERAGRVDDAVAMWRDAFDEGSRDPETVNRLSMHLKRAKDYVTAIEVIQEALNRGLAANFEESLRKRLVRCEAKVAGKVASKADRLEVAAYSIRRGSTLFEPLFQIRLKPPIRDLELMGNVARCLLVSNESSILADIDLANGSELRRVDSLPLLEDVWFAPDGRSIGIHRTAAIGQWSTLLRFIDANGHLTAESGVPDATSEIALGPDVWYVGCRNGLLYAFGLDGRQRWAWETPGSREYDGTSYFRPCPYYVASQQSFAVVASMGDIYAIAPNGKTLWHASLPNERQTRWEFTIPLKGGSGSEEPYSILGLPLNASRDQVKSAYRRLVLATHPDRNPEDSAAVDKFRRIQGAYERILAGAPTGAAGTAGITVSMEIQGFGPTASFITANAAGVVVGSSQGRLYVFDGSGQLREARVLGDGPVRAALRPDGTVGAAWYTDTLLFFKGNRIVNAAEVLNLPHGLVMLGDDLVLWRDNQVQLMDADGRLIWLVEFSKRITGVAAHGDTIVCAAGVLTAFRRRGNEFVTATTV